MCLLKTPTKDIQSPGKASCLTVNIVNMVLRFSFSETILACLDPYSLTHLNPNTKH
jgi:hypothetical protein